MIEPEYTEKSILIIEQGVFANSFWLEGNPLIGTYNIIGSANNLFVLQGITHVFYYREFHGIQCYYREFH